jgi:hypothetical protein
MKVPVIFLCLIALLTNSCENDIEINAPWKETPVVYAFIDPNTSTQYFRIEKTYQNSPSLNTEQGAKISDSLYFDTLVVKVIQGNRVFNFTKTQNIPKDDGFFADGAHFLYKCENFTGINAAYYSLNIYSPKTGNTYTSNTVGIGATSVTAVRLGLNATTKSSSQITTDLSEGRATTGQVMRLSYYEYPVGSPANGDTLVADYQMVEKYTGDRYFRVFATSFVNAVKYAIPEKSGVERKVIGIDFINVSGGTEVANIIDLSKPSISIVQKKIDYSNITEGLGIFSSRSYKLTPNIQTFDNSNWAAQKQLLIDGLNDVSNQNIVPKNLHFVP